ncbi:MAG: hypothetical protein ACYCU8_15745, partial [Ferrimicrobium acidiphilum]
EIERAFRDSAEFVLTHGSFLGSDVQALLAERLSGRWSGEAKRAVREILNEERTTPREKVERLAEVADTFGFRVTQVTEPLVPIHRDEVRLVAWMAVVRTSSDE